MNKRTNLSFADEQACNAEIERLQNGYTPAGAWTLPQACWHCWMLTKDALHAPASTELTAQQKEIAPFIDSVNLNGWPQGRDESLPMAVPAPDVGPQAIADLIAFLRAMAAYPHTHVDHFILGPIEIERFRSFLLRHVAHHLAFLVPTIRRRSNARYADLDAMIADIARLRRGYTKGGNWSLTEICWHINLGFPHPFEALEAQTELTEAQTTRQARWDHYIAHGRAPAGFEAPPEMIPPPTCSEADIDALVQRLRDLKTFNGKFIRAAAGVMPIERARGFILAHGWLHLSCLHPTHRKRDGLMFASEAGAIADIQRLREGYVAAGTWTLAQVCWHLAQTVPHPPTPADPSAGRSPGQEKLLTLIEKVQRTGKFPPGFEAPAEIAPAETCDDSAIDDLIRRLEALAAFQAPAIVTHGFGVLATERAREIVLRHAAHHLAFLRPIRGPREGLHFDSEDAAIADIEGLRTGYEQVGGWSLPQTCWHLNVTMQARLKPGPYEPNTPEQDARRETVERILASGQLPKGIVAPPAIVPPADAGDEAIEACIATLRTMRDHRGDFAPHRLFGHLPPDVARKQNLIHVAHHLSHLIPTEKGSGAGGQGPVKTESAS